MVRSHALDSNQDRVATILVQFALICLCILIILVFGFDINMSIIFFWILSCFINYDVSMNDMLWYMWYGYMWTLGLYEAVSEWILITLILQMMMVVVVVNVHLVFFIIFFMYLQSFKKRNPTSLPSFTMYYLNEKSFSILWVILHLSRRTILASY